MDFGIGEYILIALIGLLVPMGVLYDLARKRGQSRRFALWGLLSYAGLVVGLLVLLATPARQADAPHDGPSVF